MFAADKPIGIGQIEARPGLYEHTGSITAGVSALDRNDLFMKIDGVDSTLPVKAENFSDRVGFFTGTFVHRTESEER